MIFFIIFFLLFFCVLAFKKLDWAVMSIIAGLPLYLVRFKLVVPMTLLEAMILIAFLVWLFGRTRLKDFFRGRYSVKDFLKNSPWHKGGSVEGRRKYPFDIEAILLLIVSLAAVGVAHFSAASLGLWKAYFFEPLLLYVLILNVLPGKQGINKIGLSLAVGAFAVSAYAIFQKLTGIGIDNPLWQAEATRRAVSFFGYPNAVGLYLEPIIPVLAGLLFWQAKKECSPLEKKLCFPLPRKNISSLGISKAFLGFIILLSFVAVYAAKSDGALIGLAAGGLVFCLLANKKLREVALVAVLIAVIGFYYYPPIQKPIERKVTAMDLSGQIRRQQWKETLMMLNGKTKIWGTGLGNYQSAVAPYHQAGIFYDDGTDPNFHQHTVESASVRAATWQPVEIYLYPHDIFLNFWSELGLAGMFLFIWIIGKFVFLSIRLAIKTKGMEEKFLALGLLAAMIAIFVHGLVDVPYFKNDLACLFWILIALLALNSEKLTSGEKSIK
jgi:O-antigen ligase